MFWNKRIWNSMVVKLFLSICALVLPLIILHFISNYYSIQVLRSQVVQSNQDLLNLHKNQIDSNLTGVRNYLYQLSNDDDFAFYHDENTEDDHEYMKAKLRLYNKISEQAHFYTTIDSIFIYSRHHDELMYTHFGLDFLQRVQITNEVKTKLKDSEDGLLHNHWQVWQGESQYYLTYIIEEDDYYVGAWIDMSHLVTPFKFIDFGETGKAVIATSDGIAINEQTFLEEIDLDLKDLSNDHIVGDKEKYLVIKETSSIGDFDIYAFIPQRVILQQIPLMQRISFAFIIAAGVFLLALLFIMINKILNPMKRLANAMGKLQKGNLKTRLAKDTSSTEIAILNDSFNQMITEIEDLKISDYERQINLQKAELKQLQLQINPHFFLNALNIIYNLSTVKEYKLIQQMSKSLADYFRFMFKSNSYYVDLQEELKHTENYLNIQELRFPDGFSYTMEIDENVLREKIPPLIIQSLVENSIKHAFTIGEPLEIFIRAWKDAATLYLEVEDTGAGFPPDVLQALQANEELTTDDGMRIGIANVKRRLELLYGESEIAIEFKNKENSGALVHLELPLKG